MNIIKVIKNFIFTDISEEDKRIENMWKTPSTPTAIQNDTALEALAYYCALCKRGFKTKSGKSNHMRLRHRKGEDAEA